MPATLSIQINESGKRQDLPSDPDAERPEGGFAAPGVAAGVHALRAMLRRDPEGRTATAEKIVDALVDGVQRSLLRYCEGLVRKTAGSGRRAIATERNVDAEDLAQEAWIKALRYLAGPRGDRVLDDDHLRRLLKCAAKQVFLDRVTKGGSPSLVLELDAPFSGSGPSGANSTGEGDDRSLRDTIPASPRREGEMVRAPIFLEDERYAPLVETLFGDEERFHRTYRRKHQRRPRQYQAFVLYQLGAFYRDESVDGRTSEEAAGAGLMEELITEYVSLLGISAERWQPVAQAALSAALPVHDGGSLDETILAAVNAVCGTNIKAANMLAVLRYELNQFVEREKEGAR